MDIDEVNYYRSSPVCQQNFPGELRFRSYIKVLLKFTVSSKASKQALFLTADLKVIFKKNAE
jgi:hypothetical protein